MSGERAARRIFYLLPVADDAAAAEEFLHRIAAVSRACGWDYQVVAVDDGSEDASGTVFISAAEHMPVHVIRHRFSRGAGETLRDGLEWVAYRCEIWASGRFKGRSSKVDSSRAKPM